MEWIKFVSLFFNREKEANNAFANIKSNYNCNSGNVNNVPNANKKMLAWIAYDPNAQKYHVKNSVYFSQLIRDAGSVSIFFLNWWKFCTKFTGSFNVFKAP